MTVPEANFLIVDLGEDRTIQLGDSVQLEALNTLQPFEDNVYEIFWDPIDASINCDTCVQVYVSPINTTQYTATIVDTTGCSASDDITITVIKERPIYIPTAFSPNNDGQNDFFGIYGGPGVKRVQDFYIYDRWGELMFEGHNFQPGQPGYEWGGTLKGKELNPAVFVYYALIEFEDGNVIEYVGDVTLLR